MEEIRTLAVSGATMDEVAAEIQKKAKVSSD